MESEWPKVGSVWTHDKTGNNYCVVMLTNIGTTQPDRYPVTVVYQNVLSDTLWSRPLTDWHRSMTRNRFLGNRD